jgi:muconate cycloisomerase
MAIPPMNNAMPVRLSEVRVYHVRIPLKTTIRHASFVRSYSDNVVVECRLSDGSVGFGEGVPRDYVTGETIETSLSLLRHVDWAGQCSPVTSFAEAALVLAQFALPKTPGDSRHCVGNAARCAAELALLDAFGHAFGQSVSTLASVLPGCASLCEPKPCCRYGGAITSASWWRELLVAGKLAVARFRACKVKVGTEGQQDRARLRMFRRILGQRVDLRVDANEAWTAENVVAKIRELEPFGITAVEQPVPHADIRCLRDVRRQISTPIVHDESLCTLMDAERAVAEETCDLFNLRISKCGGLIPTLELAAFAKQHGLGFQLGCQIGETGILSAAGRHFACSVAGIRYLEGSFDRYLVCERLTREDLTFRWRGYAPSLKGPGLGITVDPARLASVTVSREQVYG